MKIFENDDLLVLNKPAGLPTHRADVERVGFVEYASNHFKTPLFVVHRLDKDTTGTLVFAKTPAAAAVLTRLFEEKRIKKTYLFITDHTFNGDDMSVVSRIENTREGWTSSPLGEPNSRTRFKKFRTLDRWSIWIATPETGKTHQIRLHAAALGIPILGDSLYGGTAFPSLQLHAWKVSHTGADPKLNFEFQSQPSLLYEFPELCRNPQLSAWHLSIDRRARLFSQAFQRTADSENSNQALRLIHSEGRFLRCDQLGFVNWFYWYKETPPTLEDLKQIENLSHSTGARHWILRWMMDRGANAQSRDTWTSEHAPDTWIARENGVDFEMRKSCGSSPGLFLDQRRNRLWLSENARGKSVLNLFCYTAGFSLVAARSGAREVISVDTNSVVLEWARQNFLINQIPIDDRASFYRADARFFVERAVSKKKTYDLIICDPPSFGRGPEGVFRIEKDLPQLLKNVCACLAPGGTLLLSVNYEGWSSRDFTKIVDGLVRPLHLKTAPTPKTDLDYELPDEDPIMKSIFISRPLKSET